MIAQEVRDLAAGIAADIERNGHYQDGMTEYFVPDENPDAPCCIVQSPSWYSTDDDTQCGLVESLFGYRPDAVDDASDEIIGWNDTTSTAQVIATLRKIAAGETP